MPVIDLSKFLMLLAFTCQPHGRFQPCILRLCKDAPQVAHPTAPARLTLDELPSAVKTAGHHAQ
jgi:hypothetical protein